jgi:hypothetical protein
MPRLHPYQNAGPLVEFLSCFNGHPRLAASNATQGQLYPRVLKPGGKAASADPDQVSPIGPVTNGPKEFRGIPDESLPKSLEFLWIGETCGLELLPFRLLSVSSQALVIRVGICCSSNGPL